VTPATPPGRRVGFRRGYPVSLLADADDHAGIGAAAAAAAVVRRCGLIALWWGLTLRGLGPARGIIVVGDRGDLFLGL
jgi:hypothetical protein